MSEIKTKKKKKLSKASLIIIIGISIIAIPCIIFGSILGIAWLQNGTPRNGSRFENDFTNEISKNVVKEIETDLNTISNLDSVEVVLSQGQLKIFIDTKDTLTKEECEQVVDTAYNKVTSKLPIKTYFTKTDSAKMYDLQINVFTTITASEINASNPRIYITLHKNSSEEEPVKEVVSEARDAELAKELRDEVDESEVSDDTDDAQTDGE